MGSKDDKGEPKRHQSLPAKRHKKYSTAETYVLSLGSNHFDSSLRSSCLCRLDSCVSVLPQSSMNAHAYDIVFLAFLLPCVSAFIPGLNPGVSNTPSVFRLPVTQATAEAAEAAASKSVLAIHSIYEKLFNELPIYQILPHELPTPANSF